ncbi:hypothetical protein CRG98_032807 [Punica granatum]|uniref:Uncharacterized protein n=1 Tax=Punica granatum TaxID=22663 RepID=A0A2I0IT52_PUNGR|nr:hypothetical protein CRG98_032807 [Punica granatum]
MDRIQENLGPALPRFSLNSFSLEDSRLVPQLSEPLARPIRPSPDSLSSPLLLGSHSDVNRVGFFFFLYRTGNTRNDQDRPRRPSPAVRTVQQFGPARPSGSHPARPSNSQFHSAQPNSQQARSAQSGPILPQQPNSSSIFICFIFYYLQNQPSTFRTR